MKCLRYLFGFFLTDVTFSDNIDDLPFDGYRLPVTQDGEPATQPLRLVLKFCENNDF